MDKVRALFTSKNRYLCFALLLVVAVCGMLLVLWQMRLWRHDTLYNPAFDPEEVEGLPFLYLKQITDFINPDLRNFQRMFYSGVLVTGLGVGEEKDGGNARQGRGGSSAGRDKNKVDDRVTIFDSKPATSGHAAHSVNNNDTFTANDTHSVNNNDTFTVNATDCVPMKLPQTFVRICVHPRNVDHIISSHIADVGTWEPDHVKGLAHVLEHEGSRTRPWSKTRSLSNESSESESTVTVVDVGCNVGVYTLAAASLGHKVIAVDLVSENLRLLQQSLELSDLTSRVTLLHNAIAHTRRRYSVRLESGNIGGSSLSKTPAGGNNNDSHHQSVWAVCLDDLVPLVHTTRVVLKLDIEGWEEKVLRCAGDFFQRLDVRAVLMEWMFFRYTSTAPTVIHFMLRNGLLPYQHAWRDKNLLTKHFSSWPDNVWWVKR
jgi:FkbM family methyltransferase